MTELEAEDDPISRTRLRDDLPVRRMRVLTPEAEEPSLQPASEAVDTSWAGTMADAHEVAEAVGRMAGPLVEGESKGSRSVRQIAVREVLAWLAVHPGSSWQERWEASAVEDDPQWSQTIIDDQNAVRGTHYKVGVAVLALTWLIAADAVRPSYEWMHRNHEKLRNLPARVLRTRDPAGTATIEATIERTSATELLRARYTTSALFQLARILGHTGKQSLREITPDDLYVARESAQDQRKSTPSGAAYNAMSAAGFLPEGAPATFKATLRTGPLTIEQLVDRTGIQSQKIRNLFVDYFRARSTALDYVSVSGLVGALVKNFWVEVEKLQPGIETLDLTPELAAAWKERIHTIRHGTKAGQPRKDHGHILVSVRGFYFDINDWGHSDPERYAQFAAPNPIGPGDSKAFSKAKHRQRAASHRRTRERQPHLQTLMDAIYDRLRWHTEVLRVAREHQPGEQFEVDGVVCEIAVSKAAAFGAVHGGYKRIGGLTVRRLDTGIFFDAVQQETVFFWRWATFSLLKETGVRIEELEELTHASIAQYRVPSTGELLPLLQIAPSKTDKERVLLISPELADVLASIIERVRGTSKTGRIPLVRRWDYHEKIVSEPMPYLFQRSIDGEDRPINRAWVLTQLRKTVEEIGLVDEAGEPIYFQNHDMRRIFATEAVMAGLPVHILSNVMGHDSIETTQTYVALYDEDIYRRHRAFIERRRAIRPSEEYRQPTDAEFQEFLGHFERRQLELGVCGRAYGTPCIHEHACVRCSMLQLDPRQVGRLREIAASLERRIPEARRNGWFGEVEGLEVSLAGARQKLSAADRTASGPILLGLPTFRTDEAL